MTDLIASHFAEILGALGEDCSREGLKRTPERVAESLRYLTGGHNIDPAALIRNALLESPSEDLVLVRDVQLYSLCEHHVLPFYGSVHIGYVPQGKVLGVSTFARVIDCFARRLQIQENLTDQIADALQEGLAAAGTGVVIDATHMCMAMRGACKSNASLRTVALRGCFKEPGHRRAEFFAQL